MSPKRPAQAGARVRPGDVVPSTCLEAHRPRSPGSVRRARPLSCGGVPGGTVRRRTRHVPSVRSRGDASGFRHGLHRHDDHRATRISAERSRPRSRRTEHHRRLADHRHAECRHGKERAGSGSDCLFRSGPAKRTHRTGRDAGPLLRERRPARRSGPLRHPAYARNAGSRLGRGFGRAVDRGSASGPTQSGIQRPALRELRAIS